MTDVQQAVPVAQKLLDRRLNGFQEAVAAVPYIAERLAIGQQFNAFDSSLNAEDDEDEDCTMYVCIGPVSDTRSIVSVEGRAEANMIADALTFAALSASLPCKSGEGAGQCPASPDHADIKETIEDAADDWQAKGYTSALAEVRDMAAVGRSLMEALPKGYCYMDSPAEIVSDLQNDLDEARGIFPNLTADHLADATPAIDATQTREAELASRCDGKEQLAFEEWAKSQRYDMNEHPLHYLFLDAKTAAARDGWAAGLKYASDVARAALNARGGA